MPPLNQRRLRHACRLHGLQPSYENVFKTTTWASSDVLIHTLSKLTGTSIQSDRDLDVLIRGKHQERWDAVVPDVVVAWGGKNLRIRLYLDTARFGCEFSLTAAIDSGRIKLSAGEADGSNGKVREKVEYKGLSFQAKFVRNKARGSVWDLVVKTPLALGYHVAALQIENQAFEIYCICPPERLTTPDDLAYSEGPFIPLYALRTGDEYGMGSLRELKKLAPKLAAGGARWVATLPLLAGNFDPPDCDPSPYSALTRLFWNELYIDLDEAVEFHRSEAASQHLRSPAFTAEAKRLRDEPYADYHAVYILKKSVLALLADEFFQRGSDQSEDFKGYLAQNPDVIPYSVFRASHLRDQQFHLFVQFEMSRQLQRFSETSPVGLYLDFPVGVTDAGFDFQSNPDLFFKDVSVGAPPEPVFQNGQDWGFPSFHPTRLRKSRYTYFQRALQNQLRYCRLLRLDHVMGLFRVYTVPKGGRATDGVYLRFPPEDLFAIALLEAHRAHADFIGENLGTVPPEVHRLMQKRGIKGMWVLEMETAKGPDAALSQIPPETLACLNTHDMAMLTSFLEGSDLPKACELGILSKEHLKPMTENRLSEVTPWIARFGSAQGGEFARNVAEAIRRAKPLYFVTNLEDFWGEVLPHNIPGTWKEYPNWRRKFKELL